MGGEQLAEFRAFTLDCLLNLPDRADFRLWHFSDIAAAPTNVSHRGRRAPSLSRSVTGHLEHPSGLQVGLPQYQGS